jgi:RNA polymerase sigma factor (sigma-70 family)
MHPSQLSALTELEALAQRYRVALVRFFCKRLRSGADAEDLAQEVLVRLARHTDSQKIDDVEAYLFQIAANLLRDRARRDATHFAADHISFEESGFEGEVPSEECVLEGRQAMDAFLAALAEMPPRRRMVFTLHRFAGLTYGAIAMRLGISVGVVEKHMMKALLHLHARMGDP